MNYIGRTVHPSLVAPSQAISNARFAFQQMAVDISYNNDILKVNNGAGQITVTGKLFYNQTGTHQHIDVNSITDMVVEDNIFASTSPAARDPTSTTPAPVLYRVVITATSAEAALLAGSRHHHSVVITATSAEAALLAGSRHHHSALI